MALKRKPFQGVGNILRFNWPFYALAGTLLLLLFAGSYRLPAHLQTWAWLAMGGAAAGIAISTIVSWVVYDASDLYQLKWLPAAESPPLKILNIAAGFDEVSPLLQERFPGAQLAIADFYDPRRHTEASIRRARNAYPPQPGTVAVETRKLPFETASFGVIVAMLAAHEIRDPEERTLFFKELHRVLKPDGHIFITEHLRDWANFAAYSIGAFHFHSRAAWLRNFKESRLRLAGEQKTTPFVTTFILVPDGSPA